MVLHELLRRFGIHLQEDRENSLLDTSGLVQQISLDSLPWQKLNGTIVTSTGAALSTIHYKEIVNEGATCLIQRCERQAMGSHAQESVIVKRPHTSTLQLTSEALLQALCHEIVERRGFHGAIPNVYDIYRYRPNEVHFTMSYIRGTSLLDFLGSQLHRSRHEFTALFENLLLQMCCILSVLADEVAFDHRDIRSDNLWVRYAPGSYRFEVEPGQFLQIQFEYQLVLLDFGFACIGTSSGHAQLNLGGVIPDLDPCPKTGRDLYQFFNHFLSVSVIRALLTDEFVATIVKWMAPYTLETPYLSFILTYQPTFHIHALRPSEILKSYYLRHH